MKQYIKQKIYQYCLAWALWRQSPCCKKASFRDANFLKIKNPNDYKQVQSAPYRHLEITIYLLVATPSSTSSIINTVRDHSIA